MMKTIVAWLAFLVCTPVMAQLSYKKPSPAPLYEIGRNLKVTSRNYGMLIGVQRGKYTFIELGAEMHWRKIKFVNPRIYGLSATMEYNIRYNVLGYKVGIWAKRGRVDLTYGITGAYFTDFTYNRIGIGPAIGFRLLGFHIVNGFNFTTGHRDFKTFNNLYISLRYFFPVDSKVKFKRKNKKKKDD